jgi:hypothetical protein
MILQSKAVRQIYILAPLDSADPLGFGQHSEKSYQEVLDHYPGYAQWAMQTVQENGKSADHRLQRFAQWALCVTTGTPSTQAASTPRANPATPNFSTPAPTTPPQVPSTRSATSAAAAGYAAQQAHAVSMPVPQEPRPQAQAPASASNLPVAPQVPTPTGSDNQAAMMEMATAMRGMMSGLQSLETSVLKNTQEIDEMRGTRRQKNAPSSATNKIDP